MWITGRLVAGAGIVSRWPTVDARATGPRGGSPPSWTSATRSPLAGLVEVDVGDVDDLGGIGIVGGVLGGESGLGLEALDAGRERALGLAAVGGRGVDRDLGVGDLRAVGGEDAEAEAVVARR